MGKRIKITEEFDAALDTIEQNKATLILGKAGVGKTTFVRLLEDKYSHLNIAIAAPTGIAALQAGGQTIHSLCRLSHDIIAPQELLYRDSPPVLRALDMLIIDEISMVRADIFESVDYSLRRAKNKWTVPFGGIKVVLVGDLCQLPPVVKDEDKPVLAKLGYEWPHFFTTKSYADANFKCVELTQPFRQKSARFVKLLDNIRLEQNVDETVYLINRHCFTSDNPDPLMTLVTTNAMADQINAQRMGMLPSIPCTFEGVLEGRIGERTDRLPAPMRLTLKEGAAVMLVKNDPGRNWVNGSLGVVREFADTIIHVELLTGNPGQMVQVQQAAWEFKSYDVDPSGTTVRKRAAGTFRQYPIIPAWAITIHKAQGQTLQRVRLDLGTGAFAPGQVYVALSRCRSLNDITLARPIGPDEVVCDPVVKKFLRFLRNNGHILTTPAVRAA